MASSLSADPDVWHDVNAEEDIRPEPLPLYLNHPGPNLQGRVLQSEDDFISVFLDDEVWNFLVLCTNENAPDVPPGGHMRRWHDVTVEEMKRWFALVLYMGISVKPELHMYWSRDVLHMSPFFQSPRVLSRDRFLQILNAVRFSRIADFNAADRRSRILPFLQIIRQKLPVYTPDE